MIAIGTTTAGIIVPRLDDDLLLAEAVDAVEVAFLEEDVCVLEESDEVAATADSELYCAGSVTTEVVTYFVVDIVPSSVTKLSRVTDSVVNEVGAAAVTSPVLMPVSPAVSEITEGSVVVTEPNL